MKHVNFLKIFFLLTVLITFSNFMANSQTYLSGASTNGCTAGTAGTNCTFIGCNTAPGNLANAARNTFIGDHAGFSNLYLKDNVGVGYQALYTQSGSIAYTSTYNVAVGNGALFSNNGLYNTAIGHEALYTNNNVNYNTAVGYQSGYSNTTGGYNTFAGSLSGFSNTTGANNTFSGYQSGNANTTASYNTFSGSLSGLANTTGYNNVFSGYQSGNANTTGHDNLFSGYQSGKANTTANYNTFEGSLSGIANTIGSNNTYSGYQVGYSNTIGSYNTFIGSKAGYSNVGTQFSSQGAYNSFIGYNSGYSNTQGENNTFTGSYSGYSTTGAHNTAFGYFAGYYNTTGTYNTFIGQATGGSNNVNGDHNTFVGYGAAANANNYTNATAIGNGTIATQSNSVELGNASVTLVHGPVAYTWSDGRFKFNVQENVKGLDFINKLRPVTYQMNTQQFDNFIIQNMPDSVKTIHQEGMDFAPSTAIVHSGFIAQEVDSAANVSGFTSSLVHTPANSTDYYSLAYAEFVVPLVKAVQELSNGQDSLKAIIASLTGSSKSLLIPNGGGRSFNDANSQQVELISNDAILYQNIPNPFGEETTINYYLPENVNNAKMLFYDEMGRIIKEVNLNEKGNNSVVVNSKNLNNGIYSYSLIVDEKIISTLKMQRVK